MKTSPDFESILVSPCGLYCGACSGFLREKNKCNLKTNGKTTLVLTGVQPSDSDVVPDYEPYICDNLRNLRDNFTFPLLSLIYADPN